MRMGATATPRQKREQHKQSAQDHEHALDDQHRRHQTSFSERREDTNGTSHEVEDGIKGRRQGEFITRSSPGNTTDWQTATVTPGTANLTSQPRRRVGRHRKQNSETPSVASTQRDRSAWHRRGRASARQREQNDRFRTERLVKYATSALTSSGPLPLPDRMLKTIATEGAEKMEGLSRRLDPPPTNRAKAEGAKARRSTDSVAHSHSFPEPSKRHRGRAARLKAGGTGDGFPQHSNMSNHDSAVSLAALADAIARQAPPAAKYRAGLLYLQLGRWPPWMAFVARSAAFNRNVFFYFLGPSSHFSSNCSNCALLPLDGPALAGRITNELGLPLNSVAVSTGARYRKLCDLKPFWPALFPDLAARHTWIGYADSDIVFGDLAGEIDRLHGDEDLVVPATFYPLPLANGNLLLMRTEPKMMRAFERSPDWREALTRPDYSVFDEWWGEDIWKGKTMASVYQDMLLDGQLVAKPTRRLLVQDSIFIPGLRNNGAYPTIELGANLLQVIWRRGSLTVARRGICICPAETFQVGLTACQLCFSSPGTVFRDVEVFHSAAVLGFHFQEWKRSWTGKVTPALTRCSTAEASFSISREGFSC